MDRVPSTAGGLTDRPQHDEMPIMSTDRSVGKMRSNARRDVANLQNGATC
jgi:hypothetical protein